MKNTISVLLAIFLVSFLAIGMVSALPTVKQVTVTSLKPETHWKLKEGLRLT